MHMKVSTDVDKTGTLTQGKPRLVSVTSFGDCPEDTMLQLAASLERSCEHSLATAIVDGAIENNISLADVGLLESMTGGGINDAPALAQTDVSIAMGAGTDVAMESAGVTSAKQDLRCIVRARRLSRATMRNTRQNQYFAFIYNSLGVPAAAGVLLSVIGILLSPIIAATAMSFNSVSVISNALRLRGVSLKAQNRVVILANN